MDLKPQTQSLSSPQEVARKIAAIYKKDPCEVSAKKMIGIEDVRKFLTQMSTAESNANKVVLVLD